MLYPGREKKNQTDLSSRLHLIKVLRLGGQVQLLLASLHSRLARCLFHGYSKRPEPMAAQCWVAKVAAQALPAQLNGVLKKVRVVAWPADSGGWGLRRF